ncbi:carbohydrate porin [Sphingomonas sp. ASY06-1R]|uniref:carbohydrate porin n=1 Tax=Sphingomonas sp. ASY06-1R TaxID=3445771 RepID=UPI003FA1B67B
MRGAVWRAGFAHGAILAICALSVRPAFAQTSSGPPARPDETAISSQSAEQIRVRDRAQRKRSGDMSPANEQADTQRPPPPGLAGDWFGLKQVLADKGIGVTARYASETALNVTGGRRTDITETGQLDVGALIDLKKLVGLEGGSVQATITYRRGHDLGQRAGLGVLQQVQEVYGRGQTIRLTQFWYEQMFGGDRLDMKVGRTAPGEDFAAFSCSFQNLSFCGSQPGNIAGDYWYNWPVSQWGARARVNFGMIYVQAAVYEQNPRNLERGFLEWHFHDAAGALVPVEIGAVRGGRSGGPVGSFKLGGWISTSDAPDVLLNVNRTPAILSGDTYLQRSSRSGVWINLQQQLTGRSKDGKSIKGLSLFVNMTQSDRQTSTVDNQLSLGLFYRGLIPYFTEDVFGLGLARTHVNARVADRQRLRGEAPQSSEYAAEFYYSFHPRSWLELRPNLQWVHRPGGYRHVDDVGVLGLKGALTL